jgi:hypothetical protein
MNAAMLPWNSSSSLARRRPIPRLAHVRELGEDIFGYIKAFITRVVDLLHSVLPIVSFRWVPTRKRLP